MSGKVFALIIVVCAAAAGIAVYYLQIYAFYEELPPDAVSIEVTPSGGGDPVPLPATVLRAIDADSSPLRFRACFTLDGTEMLAGAAPAEDPVPLTAPGWFDCFDAAAIGAALEAGDASAYLGRTEIRPGVDRVFAVFPDGRGFAWHQLNGSLDE